MEKKSPEDPKRSGDSPRIGGGLNFWIFLTIALVFLLLMWTAPLYTTPTIQYDFFVNQVKAGNVLRVTVKEDELSGQFKDPPEAPPTYNSGGKLVEQRDKRTGKPVLLARAFRVELLRSRDALGLEELLDKYSVQRSFAADDGSRMYMYALMLFVPLGLLVFLWMSYRRRSDQLMGGSFLSGFSKSPAKRYEASRQGVTFDDVAGLTGVKADLLEIVDFLKNPAKFQKLGGRVPKGVLLNGPPGTGKTLLARAIAGEAGVPFFSVNGSEFIQMFVGVGASRVRDLFKNSKEQAPAIIFIDEIDAVGRQRGAGLGGGHDEREQTLNQILSEMDGFAQNDSVIVVAATNRPDVLDPALLRPGRFDRHITVGRPTLKGRVEIFKVHVRDVPLSNDVKLDLLAAKTVGLTGADIRNIVNEAALWAARHDKTMVEMKDFDYSMDKVLMGAKREEVLKEGEKEKTAYHEAGHTLTAWFLPSSDRVHKVSIIPRGRALGATHTLPSEDRLSRSETELRDHLVMLLGGRAAELLVYQEPTIGAENDLERATGLARRMVTHWGMSNRLGPVSYKLSEDDPFLGREIHQQRQFSEHTMEVIDEEVAQILHEASQRAMVLLKERRPELDKITKELLAREELDEDEITQLIGTSLHVQQRQQQQERSPADRPSTTA